MNHQRKLIMNRIYLSCLFLLALFNSNLLQAQCVIENVIIDATACNNLNEFDVVIDFEWGGGTDSFVVAGNGNNYGTFAKADLPVTLDSPFFVGDNSSIYEFVIYDSELQAYCSADVLLGPLGCGPVPLCEIADLSIVAVECVSQDIQTLVIDFEYSDAPNDYFDIIDTEGNYLTSFLLSDLPVTWNYDYSDVTVIETLQICINDTPDCCADTDFTLLNCPPNGCQISGPQMNFSTCDAMGNFYITLHFDYQNTADSFDLAFIPSDIPVLVPYAYTDLPIQLGPFNNNDFQTFSATFYDQDNPDCTASVTASYFCNDPCEIFEMDVQVGDCNASGVFPLTINFEAQNPANDFFDLFIDQEFIGFYPLSDLPLEYDYSATSGSGLVQVCINDNPDCCAQMEFENPCNNNCEIGTISFEPNCDGDISFGFINFDHDNTSDSFNLTINNDSYTFAYTDLPVNISPLPDNGNVYMLVTVTDQNDPNCGNEVDHDAIDCSVSNCEIWDLVVEAHDCDGEFFLVDLDFNFNNTSDSFSVVGNGMNYGNFAYADLFITLGPFEANGMVYEFIISDSDQPDCGGFTQIESEDCTNGGDCEISNLDVYPLTCNPDGSYSVLILFDYENVNSDLFDVYSVNGNFIDTYNYNQLPLTIPSFPASGNANDVITVCNNDSDQCCAVAEFEALDCSACEIVNVLLEEQPCAADFNFMISLDLEVQGNGALGFLVLGNGTNYGAFDYADLPIELGPFTGDPITTYEFIVVDIANTSCTGSATIGPIDCQAPQPIWPGDVNLDFISNHFDLLNIGVTYGETGAERAVSAIDWMSFEGDNWAGTFANGANWKHADCNGDGEINNIDLTAIENNYDETHGTVLPYEEIDIASGSPSFFIDLPDFDEITLGEAFVAPIILGDQDTPVDQIYGIAFTVEYDPTMMDEAGVYVETGSSWLGEQNTQLISIDKSFADEGIIEVAITRTDHEDTAGFGTISYFIGIIDDIAGKSELAVEITNVVAITYEEARISLETPTAIIDLTTSLEKVLDNSVTVFPNPAQETLNIFTTGLEIPTQIKVYNTLGQLIEQIEAPTEKSQLNVNNWIPGIYFLDIQFEQGAVNKKVEVLK
ncbi:MAG: hypothetical protein ACI8YQ_000575 [Polaribacter sp.]|jgi:hypothetical protein